MKYMTAVDEEKLLLERRMRGERSLVSMENVYSEEGKKERVRKKERTLTVHVMQTHTYP